MSATSFSSVSSMFLHRIEHSPEESSFTYPDENDSWITATWKETGEAVKLLAGGLMSLGLNLEERCAIFSNTRYDWVLVDMGILCGGGATTTIYPSTSAEEAAFILSDSGTRFLFAEDQSQVDKIISQKENLPNLEKIIVIDGDASNDGFVISFQEIKDLGLKFNEENPESFINRVKEQKPDHLATLIYTSGTTGTPKGVELTHDCWVFEGEIIDKCGLIGATDKQYLWLPLSHSFGKVLLSAVIRVGSHTVIDGRLDKIVGNLAHAQPTFMAGVPRIFEKIYNKIITGAKAGGEDSMKYKIFKWAVKTGLMVSSFKQKGLEPSATLKLKYAIATKLVFQKVQNIFGGKIRFLISGSAPLSKEIAEFFHAADLLIVEGYGLTESSAASFVNLPSRYKFGTVGKPLPGVELKLIPVAGDDEDPKDEILIAGRGIMRGYYNLEEKSKEVFHIDENGKKWLRTGDAGEIDPDGFLKITDRIKNLIKTSGGKYVAPQKIEGKFKTICPFVSEALVHGNKRNFCSMLLTLDAEYLQKWASDAGISNKSYEELTKLDALNKVIQEYLDVLNSDLMKYETIKKFAILPKEFTIEDGELTPSMKLKRKAVERKYMDVLDGFYVGALNKI